jgi:glutathione synthase/RimK-type ligase-like ATP-grasp enzyme
MNWKMLWTRVGYPLVIKPVDGNHGKGATTNINDFQSAEKHLRTQRIIQGILLLKNL